MIYHCKWILLQALHVSGQQFIMQSKTGCILSLSFSYILKLISLMNFDGSFPSMVWNIQCFSTHHFRSGCQGPGGRSSARPPATAPTTGPGHVVGARLRGQPLLMPHPSQLPLAPRPLAPLPLALGTIAQGSPTPTVAQTSRSPAPRCCHGDARPHDVALQVLSSSASQGL